MVAALVLAGCATDDGGESLATEGPSTTQPAPTAAPATEPPATTVAAATIPAPTATEAEAEAETVSPAEPMQTITVGGMGAEYGPPDHAVVDIGVEVRRASVIEASSGAAAAGAAMTDALVAAGVPEADVQTSDFRVEPNHDPSDYLSIVGYSVHLGYRVTMPDVGAVGTVLANAIQAGGDSVRAWGVRFGGDPAGLMETARETAWADVSRRAQSTAELAGEPLGDVLDVHEKVLVTTPQGMMQGGEGDSASFDIPVSPGRVGVVVLLTVTYAIGE